LKRSKIQNVGHSFPSNTIPLPGYYCPTHLNTGDRTIFTGDLGEPSIVIGEEGDISTAEDRKANKDE